MEIPKLSLLTKEQVYGYNKLKLFDVIDPSVAVTDTAILRGAYVSDYHVYGDDSLSGRTGFYQLQNSDGNGGACGVNDAGYSFCYYCNGRFDSVRAALPYSQIQSISPNCVRCQNGIEKIEYGFYPGMVVSSSMQSTLETAYNSRTLSILGKGCTFDSRKYDDYDESFLAEEQIYYEYNGGKYARIKANSAFGSSNKITLSNGENYVNDNYVWVKVEPLVWLKHPDDDIMVSEKGFVSGIRLKDLKYFLDNYLSKDIVNPILFNNSLNKKSENDKNQEIINNIIYKDKDGNTIKKVKSKVRAKRNES